MQTDKKQEVITRLKQDLLRWQGVDMSGKIERKSIGLLDQAFPGGLFPIGAVHEFVCYEPEHIAVTKGLIGCLLARLMGNQKACIWVSTSRSLFPPAIKAFDVDPDRMVFVEMDRERNVSWAIEESLKCEGVAAVVSELSRLDFVQSRRMQLMVEKTGITSLVILRSPRILGATASAARWQVRPLPSGHSDPDMPGVGFPRWEVALLKVRNGQPSIWQVEWRNHQFQLVTENDESEQRRPAIYLSKTKIG